MEDHIFDAILALCYAAEEDGFSLVSDALEMTLDVYLIERSKMSFPEPVFRSKRAERRREISAWVTELDQDMINNWSMGQFPAML